MDIERKKAFSELSEELLNATGQEAIAAYLETGNEHAAAEYMLGAVDRLYIEHTLTFDQAAERYERLGVSRDRASQLRQNSKHAREFGTD